MIPIREHNDIVQKLMKEISNKDIEIKSILKEKGKYPSQTPQLQPTNNQLTLNKKISQLNKEHKERISVLSQQLKSKQVQNNDLKERLIIKQNMQIKEKEHIAQILKKTYDRKPSSGADYKISALITHYESEIEKKSKFIQTLQKQIRELQIQTNKGSKGEVLFQNNKAVINTDEAKGISLAEHQKQIQRAKLDSQKHRKLFEEKEKEYRDLARRYSDLTNQYYKIVNSYGLEQQKTKTSVHTKSEPFIELPVKKMQGRSKINALENLLQQMVCSESQTEQTIINKKGFASKLANIKPQSMDLSAQSMEQSYQQEQQIEGSKIKGQQHMAIMRLDEIMESLKISDPRQIMPLLIKIKASLEEYSLVDTISRSLQVFFFNIGKGKLTKKELIGALEDLEPIYCRQLEAIDVLDEVCMEAGAKREKLRERIQQLVKTTNQYYSKLKSLKFMQDVSKGNKVIQFIDFFELDKEELALPQQLMKIQQQLRSIDKFLKESRAILDIDNQTSSQDVLELVLRYIEKTSSIMNHLQSKKTKKKSREQ